MALPVGTGPQFLGMPELRPGGWETTAQLRLIHFVDHSNNPSVQVTSQEGPLLLLNSLELGASL